MNQSSVFRVNNVSISKSYNDNSVDSVVVKTKVFYNSSAPEYTLRTLSLYRAPVFTLQLISFDITRSFVFCLQV